MCYLELHKYKDLEQLVGWQVFLQKIMMHLLLVQKDTMKIVFQVILNGLFF